VIPANPESTAILLQRIRGGDAAARDRLLARYLPLLRRWAHGRLPGKARGFADTDDLVQITLLRVLKQLERFEPRHEGAFLAYLRRILINAMRDEIARAATRGRQEPIGEDLRDSAASPLEAVMGRDMLDRYETAFAALGEEQQEAVFMRIEMGFTYEQIAEAMGKNSANTARMLVARALARLAETMEEPRGRRTV
jgi:RNA polymerase sigma-70 factor (ECF subfamily)